MSDCFAARALWMLGYPDQALTRVERGVSVAQQLAHAESLIVAMHFAAHLHQLRGEAALSQDRAETVIALSEEYGLAMWIAFGHMQRGWARVEQGHTAEGVRSSDRGSRPTRRRARSSGRGISSASWPGRWREPGRRGSAGGIGAGPRLHRQHRRVLVAAELYRLEGELLTARGRDAGKVQASVEKALGIARDQRARSWELRVLTTASLRHSHRHPLGDDADRALREAYEWFSEGHETADLLAARNTLRDGSS